MRVLVIGLGSIGARRARILRELGCELDTVDANGARASQFGRATTLFEVCARRVPPDAAFICTPAETHGMFALACAEAGMDLFIEKPLATNMAQISGLRNSLSSRITMVACNMRFAYNLPKRAWTLLDLVSSRPLSQWRNGADSYRQTGIILESAIHEIDLAYSVNGPITSIRSSGDEDKATIAVGHANMAETHIEVDWSEGAAVERYALIGAYDDGEAIRALHVPQRTEPITSDAMYRWEMEHFLECVQQRKPTCNPIEDAAHVLEWALKANNSLTVVRT